MGPEGKPVREPWHKKGQCLVAGTRLMPENLSLVAKMRKWNSNRVCCVSEKIIITKKVQGRECKPQIMVKRQNLTSGHILTVAYLYPSNRLTPSSGV